MASTELPAIVIRQATPADCPSAAACQIASWLESYADFAPHHVLSAFAADVPNRIADWHSRISRPELTALLVFSAAAADEVIGFATAERAVSEETGRKELESLYVLRAWQGRGIGKRLMDEVLGGENVKAEVWVFEDNVYARRWYVNRGFGEEVREKWFNEGVERWEVKLVRE